jgi:hypothetical protein
VVIIVAYYSETISLKETLEDLKEHLINDYHYDPLDNDYGVSAFFDNYYEMTIDYIDGKVVIKLIDDCGDVVKEDSEEDSNLVGCWVLAYDEDIYMVHVEK